MVSRILFAFRVSRPKQLPNRCGGRVGLTGGLAELGERPYWNLGVSGNRQTEPRRAPKPLAD